MKRPVVVAAVLIHVALPGRPIFGQDVHVSGFIKAESIYDTRQVEQIREGHFNLYPLPRVDENGDNRDDNATDNLLMTAFQSRILASGVDSTILGVRVSGTLEVDFFGTTNENVNALRLRHAYVKLDWPHHELLVGQYWSPLFTAVLYPQVINFSTGAPFQPFARFPQISYTYKPGSVQLMAALTQQRDAYQEIGGRKMQQQAGLPAAHLHAQLHRSNYLLGIGGTIKAVRPEVTADRFTAGAIQGYGRVSISNLEFRGKVTYGYDLVDHLMTGGFISAGFNNYSCLGVLASWLDLTLNVKPWSVGFFAGYLENLGTKKDMAEGAMMSVNARAPNVNHMWRISPRVTYSISSLRLAFELETTGAAYCSHLSTTMKPMTMSGDKTIVNVRGLLAVYYFF